VTREAQRNSQHEMVLVWRSMLLQAGAAIRLV